LPFLGSFETLAKLPYTNHTPFVLQEAPFSYFKKIRMGAKPPKELKKKA
jgi:hypothetical protein